MVEGYPNRRGKLGRKRKWKDMCITRVKLNPEQAVLTCCDTAGVRGFVDTAWQCVTCGTAGLNVSS